jgi:hypothetical protein
MQQRTWEYSMWQTASFIADSDGVAPVWTERDGEGRSGWDAISHEPRNEFRGLSVEGIA